MARLRFLFLPALLVLSSPAHAQTYCAHRDQMVTALEGYGEQVVARGLRSDGRMVEIFATPDGGTWTVVTTGPEHQACVNGVGKAWRGVKPPVKKMGLRI